MTQAVCVILILTQCVLMISAQNVACTLNINGVNSITWNGYTFWSGASQDYPSTVDFRFADGSTSNWALSPTRTLDADGKGLTLAYPYASTKFRYTTDANKLKIDVTVTNLKNSDILYMDISLFKLVLPSAATNWQSSGSFIVCENSPANTTFPAKMYLQYPSWFPNSFNPINRKIPALSSVTFSLTIYFGAPGVQPLSLAYDTVSKWAVQRPYVINWPDRRPLAMDVIAVSEPQYHSASNPRGWFGDPNLNAFSADLRNRLLGRADIIINNCKIMNCQGVVTWDIEGQEFPHAISYIGDPSLLSKFAPEMDPIADEYIGKFKAAGLKVGFTIRPQKVVYSPANPPVTWADQQYAANNDEALQWLLAKVAYAKNRWGASMFYVDTNTNVNGGTLDPQVFRNLQIAEPNCVFFPEWQSIGYYGVGGPYDDLKYGIKGTPADARILYPNSFTMLVINDGNVAGNKEILKQSVAGGDILMSASWWNGNPDINTVAEIYAAVTSPSPSPVTASRTPSPSSLPPASQSPSSSPSRTPSPSSIPSASQTPSSSPSNSPPNSPSPSSVASASSSPSSTPSRTPSPSSAAASQSPTSSVTPTRTPSPSSVASASPTSSPSSTPSGSPSPSAVPSVIPSSSPSASSSPSSGSSKSPSPNRRRVTYTLTSQGITSLVFDDKNFVNPSVPSLPSAPDVQFSDGTSAYYANPTSLALEDNGNSLTLTYPYGKTKFKYSSLANKFSVDITVTNTGTKTIKYLEMIPLRFTFPSIASTWNGNYVMGSNLEGPTMPSLEGSWGIVTATNEEVTKGLLVGFPFSDNSPSNTMFGLRVYSEVPSNMTNTFDKLERTVAPGTSVTFKISLRFGISGDKATDLISDIYTKWRRQYPFDNYWGNRGPIGMEILAVADDPYKSATNPRGWFGNPNLNVLTTEGKANFKSLLMTRAQTVIDNCAIMKCQGVIIWDIEGQQFAHPTSYIGDPRALPSLAPEMNEIADEYINKFKTAGLQVGFTIRPQKLTYDSGVTTASQTYLSNSDALTEIKAKVGYAVTRWNASLFYLNSNMNQAGAVLNPQFMRDLHSAYPNVLFVPDGRLDSYFMASSPYTRYSQTSKGTPSSAITLYPESFSTVYVSDSVNSNTEADIQAMVNRGEILLVRSWYYSPEMDTIGSMISKSSYVAPQNPYGVLNAGNLVGPSFVMLFVIVMFHLI